MPFLCAVLILVLGAVGLLRAREYLALPAELCDLPDASGEARLRAGGDEEANLRRVLAELEARVLGQRALCRLPPPPPTPPRACNVAVESDGSNPMRLRHDLGAAPGRVRIAFDMEAIPDRMDVVYRGRVVASTGRAVAQGGALEFDWSPEAGDTVVEIVVTGTENLTSWRYRISCPVVPTPPPVVQRPAPPPPPADDRMRIPERPADMAFAQGCWRTDPFQHSPVHAPGVSTYCFDAEGRGSLTFRRAGMTCRAPARLTRNPDGTLSIVDADTTCSDGSAWFADRLICRPGAGGVAVCSGVSVGTRWNVNLHREGR